MLKKSLAVATLSIACAIGFAPMAQAAEDVPDFDDDVAGLSISDARDLINGTGNLMIIDRDSTILDCDDEAREATALRELTSRVKDRSVVVVTFSCPEE